MVAAHLQTAQKWAQRLDWRLKLILVIGLALRLWGISFGLPNIHCRPDESLLVNRALSIGAGELNPHFFNYPSLHLYLLALLYGALFAIGRMGGWFSGLEDFQRLFFTDPSIFYLIGRLCSALLGTGSIWLVYLLGRQLGGRRTGWFSALLLSVAFLHVRDSHFLTVDIPATFYMLAGYVFLLRYLERPGWDRLCWGAVCFGLAASTKYNLALFAVSIWVATILATPAEERKRLWPRLAGSALITGLAFAAGTPYALLDFSSFWRDLAFERLHFATGHGDPIIDLGRGWWHHLRFTLPYGLGLPWLAAALAGLGVMAWRHRSKELVLLSGLLVYCLVAGSGKTVFMRYMLPVVPLLCVTAGQCCGMVQRRWGSWWAMLLVAVLVVPAARTAWQYGWLLRRLDTRVLAAAWIAREIPSGSRLALLGSSYGQPQLRRSREWLQDELDDLRKVGLQGRRLAAMLAINDFPPPPSYYPIELRGEQYPRRTVWPRYDLAQLRTAGVTWVVTQDHPLTGAQQDWPFVRELEQQAILAQSFDPFLGSWDELVFDPQDVFYVPVAGFARLDRPGPLIRIYRLK